LQQFQARFCLFTLFISRDIDLPQQLNAEHAYILTTSPSITRFISLTDPFHRTINMADQLNMNGLSLNDSQHAPNGGFERSTYIPPTSGTEARRHL